MTHLLKRSATAQQVLATISSRPQDTCAIKASENVNVDIYKVHCLVSDQNQNINQAEFIIFQAFFLKPGSEPTLR